jgi:hypothetical protein
MYGDLETQKSYWKDIGHDLVTADKKVSNRPCFLYSVCLVAGTGGAATAVIRDGHETSSEPVLDLAALTSSNDSRKFDPPLYLKKGMFIDVYSNVTSVFVHFMQVKE